MPDHFKKYLSLDEVDALIPVMKRIVSRIQSLQKILEVLDTIEIEVDSDDHHNVRCVTRFNKAYHRLSYEFYERLDLLETKGGILRDIREGVVDFPHMFEGREVHLCWRIDEDGISHWHENNESYEERKKILNLNHSV